PCTLDGGELAGAWDAAVRGRVIAALRDRDGADRVVARLDDYADSWRRARVEACRATRVAGVQSERLLDLRVRCLDRRRAQLGAMTALLAAADHDAIAHAIDAAFALPELRACADTVALSAAVPPPDDPALRARIEQIDRRVDRARALQLAGKLPASLDEAHAAAAMAGA